MSIPLPVNINTTKIQSLKAKKNNFYVDKCFSKKETLWSFWVNEWQVVNRQVNTLFLYDKRNQNASTFPTVISQPRKERNDLGGKRGIGGKRGLAVRVLDL